MAQADHVAVPAARAGGAVGANEQDSTPPDAGRTRILRQWLRGISLKHKAHEQCTARFEARGMWLAIATAVASTVVGSSFFADTGEDGLPPALKVAAGILSLIAAILATIQGTLKYSERVALHRAAAKQYAGLRHNLELLLSSGSEPSEEAVGEIKTGWEEIDGEAPGIPQELFDRLSKERPALNS